MPCCCSTPRLNSKILNFSNNNFGHLTSSFSIFTHFFTVIDLKVIKAGVNFIFDYFVGPEIENVARQDIIHGEYTLEDDDQDANRDRSSLRKKFTEIFGAIFNKQDCWRRTMCKMGNMMKDIQSKDVFFM